MTFEQMNSDDLGEEPKMMPLGTDESFGVTDEVDLVGSGMGKKRVSDATIVLVATLFVAFGGLAGMRWMASRSTGVSMDETVETKVSAFIQAMTGTAVVGMSGSGLSLEEINSEDLADDRTDSQVQLGDLKKNPFMIGDRMPKDEPGQVWSGQSEEEKRRAERERLRVDLERQLRGLRLSSIMGSGDRHIAVINNEVVQPGMRMGSFKIKSIEALSVLLEAEGFEFHLSLE